MTIYRDACRSVACRGKRRDRLQASDAVLVFVAILLGAIRALGVRHEAFQAAAHLYVGGLLGFVASEYRRGTSSPWGLQWSLAVGLSLLEVVCFLLGVGR